jgi:cytoplasmic iron level regulating protein YaaA (DUF328/UPF0246 family)
MDYKIYKNIDELKSLLPDKNDKIKIIQNELIDKDREIRDKKDNIKYKEALAMLNIDPSIYKNQTQRDAKLSILHKEDKELSKLYKELYDLLDVKARKEAELNYEETNLRILFYYYKDLIRLPIDKELTT